MLTLKHRFAARDLACCMSLSLHVCVFKQCKATPVLLSNFKSDNIEAHPTSYGVQDIELWKLIELLQFDWLYCYKMWYNWRKFAPDGGYCTSSYDHMVIHTCYLMWCKALSIVCGLCIHLGPVA